MNTLMWILSVVAYFVFSYSFALLNLWAWKKGVRVTVQRNRKEAYREHFEEEVTYSVQSSGVARIFWPFLSTDGDGSPQSLIFSKKNEERARIEYLVWMTLVCSATKAAALPIQWIGKIIPIAIEQLFDWLGRSLSKLPGAKKAL